MRPPILTWARGYDRAWISRDVVGGLVAGAVVIPQAMAYATIANLPVQVGLYTCMVPMVLYALPRILARCPGEFIQALSSIVGLENPCAIFSPAER